MLAKRNIVFILIAFAVLISNTAFAQLTKIRGTITDSASGEAIPFVHVVFQNTNIGTTSDFEGKYFLESYDATDSLIYSTVGYHRLTVPIKKGQYQEVNVTLNPKVNTLTNYTVIAGENPAVVVLKNVIKNRDNNNPIKNLDSYQYEVYNKIRFDANNLTDEFMNRKVFKPFQFIFDHIDTSALNGKTYLPLFLTESLSDYYYRKDPKATKEIIKASKISGLDNESYSQFLGDMYQNVNVYRNYVTLFDKNFISPISGVALLYYNYYMVDTVILDDHFCYEIMFKPKRKQEMTFTGSLWIDTKTYAIKKLDVTIAKDANINFINDIQCVQEFRLVDGKYWMKHKENIIIDFNVFEDEGSVMGFFGHKTTSYSNYIFNSPLDDPFYSTASNIEVNENSLERSEDFWTENRHDSLNRDEQTIYYMVDTLKTLPAFNTWVDIINMVLTGYYIHKDFEFGPYASTLSFNEVEGMRVRLGGRTSNDFSTKIMFEAYAAYGSRDNKFKYRTGFSYIFNKLPRRAFGLFYKNDIEQLGQSDNAFREDFFLASFLRRNPFDKLTMVEEWKSYYEHEWFPGLSNTVTFKNRVLFPGQNLKFEFFSNQKMETKSSITTSEIKLHTRFAYQEKFIMGEFERVSLGTPYPVLELNYTYGIKGFMGGDFLYHRADIMLTDWFNIATWGWSKYVLQAGRIWGTLPYPLLHLHEGNETYAFDQYSFNTMNYFEFASDKWISLYYTHHFDGLFLNKIPLMRKLKWREVAFVNAVAGNLDEKNLNYSNFPYGMSVLSKPYFEAGIGVENIFKFLRIDAIWRLSHLNKPGVTRFGIYASFMVMF